MNVDRSHTMSVRALRRLSETEVAGLGLALDVMETAESTLCASLPAMRAAADKETRARQQAGLPLPGPYLAAWRTTYSVVAALSEARVETHTAATTGKVER